MRVSLIVTTYNRPDALQVVLNSLKNQNCNLHEVIIADDGSDESTLAVIKHYSAKALIPIIHSWQEDDGCRIPHSRNRAIAKSNFEYIIMIDGDTVLHKDFIKDHKRFAKKGIYIQGSRALLQLEFTNNLLRSNAFKKPSLFFKHSKNLFNNHFW